MQGDEMRTFFSSSRKRVAGILCFAQAIFGQYYLMSTVAGNGRNQFEGAGGLAAFARLISPRAVALDGAGNLFVSDSYFHQVFRIATSGTITILAGSVTG
jgi:hypothetical protein